MKSIKKNVDIEKVSLPKTNKKERKKSAFFACNHQFLKSGHHLALFSEKLSGALVALAKKGRHSERRSIERCSLMLNIFVPYTVLARK